jgi:hypothetical protein
MKNKSPTPDQKNEALLKDKNTSASTQRNQILSYLKIKQSLNTLELRELGFISPAPRLQELRQRGHNIISIREDVFTPDGRLHRRVARYYLSNIPPANDACIEDLA